MIHTLRVSGSRPSGLFSGPFNTYFTPNGVCQVWATSSLFACPNRASLSDSGSRAENPMAWKKPPFSSAHSR